MKKLFILVLALVMAFAALPVFAQDKAEWAFYGSVRMWTAWESVDEDTPPQLSNGGFTTPTFGIKTAAKALTYGTEAKGDDEIAWLLQSNSRIGANVKWGNIGGRFEYGHSSAGNVTLRLLYGTWNFGAGTLLIGQDYGPYDYRLSGLCGPGGGECSGFDFGAIYTGRDPQIKLIFGGFKVALEAPELQQSFRFAYPTTPISNVVTSNASLMVDRDQTLPRLSASYTFNMGPGQFFIGGIYNTYTQIFNVAGSEREHDVDGWLLGAGTKLGFGPFYVNASVQYGENPNNAAGEFFELYPSVNLYNSATDASEDSEYMTGQLILGYKLTSSITFEGGVMWQSGKVDDVTVAGRNWEQDTWVYYLQCVWSPAKNVFFVPEFGIIDYNKLEVANQPDVEFGKLTWFGIKWMINF